RCPARILCQDLAHAIDVAVEAERQDVAAVAAEKPDHLGLVAVRGPPDGRTVVVRFARINLRSAFDEKRRRTERAVGRGFVERALAGAVLDLERKAEVQ